jgi:hypothetical protein
MSYNLETIGGKEPTNQSDISENAKLGVHIVQNTQYGGSGNIGDTGGQNTTNNNNTLAAIINPGFSSTKYGYTTSHATYLTAAQQPQNTVIISPYYNNWMDKIELLTEGNYLVYWVVPSQNDYNHKADLQLIDVSTGNPLSHKVSAESTSYTNTNMLIVATVSGPRYIGVKVTNAVNSNYGFESKGSMWTNYIYIEKIV